MGHTVAVVDLNPRAFGDWNNRNWGLGAQLNALGYDGDAPALEHVRTAEQLDAIAAAARAGQILPRAVVLQNVYGSGRQMPNRPPRFGDPAARPSDYDEATDPAWEQLGDGAKLLAPHVRLLAARAVRRAMPDADTSPTAENLAAHPELFGLHNGHPVPRYGAFLARINEHLARSGEPFMAIVDTLGEQAAVGEPFAPIDGADIDHMTPSIALAVELPAASRDANTARHIALVAHLIMGEYPPNEELPYDPTAGLILPHLTAV